MALITIMVTRHTVTVLAIIPIMGIVSTEAMAVTDMAAVITGGHILTIIPYRDMWLLATTIQGNTVALAYREQA